MKLKLLFALLAVFFAFSMYAQPANAGFEDWSGNVPTDWSNNNIAPLDLYPVTPSTDSHSGSLAAKGEVLDNPLSPGDSYPPLIQSISGELTGGEPQALTGWYKLNALSSTNNLVVSITLTDEDGMMTGFGVGQYYNNSSTYSSFSISIDYSLGSQEVSTDATVSFTLADDSSSPTIGSFFIVDDITLDGTVGLDEFSHLSLDGIAIGQIFPQPFYESAFVELDLDRSHWVKAEVFDLMGKRLDVLLDDKLPSGEMKLEWNPSDDVPSGNYFMRISIEGGNITRKLYLQK